MIYIGKRKEITLMSKIIEMLDRLERKKTLKKEEFIYLLSNYSKEDREYLAGKARERSRQIFGNKIYIRGLIEFTNYCKNDCYYCGIRLSNKNASRYRLSHEDIINCCKQGYQLGFRTFVLQGGEDNFYSDEKLIEIIREIKRRYPDCAITLSIGERTYDSYLNLYNAGVDRYLLRHETANEEHFSKLHPKNLQFIHRKKCLQDLKSIGYQVGCGFMVGSPYQTVDNIVEDLLFIKELSPAMIGIGPFLPHHDTPFARENKGSYELTLVLISILRLLIPNALIPATTALGTIDPNGREAGILSGGNVVMPNLSPVKVRKKYDLYDNKICTGDEAAECRVCLQGRMKKIGYELVVGRGDFIAMDF